MQEDFPQRAAVVGSWIPPEIPQPSAKSLEAVDKLASYMKAKAAKNPPEPKEPRGPRVRSDEGRFGGVRVNEDDVPRLPIFPAQWAIEDPRQRPYLVIWGKGAYALKMAVSEGGKAVGAFTDERDRHRVGAHAVARDAAGGVGGADATSER